MSKARYQANGMYRKILLLIILLLYVFAIINTSMAVGPFQVVVFIQSFSIPTALLLLYMITSKR